MSTSVTNSLPSIKPLLLHYYTWSQQQVSTTASSMDQLVSLFISAKQTAIIKTSVPNSRRMHAKQTALLHSNKHYCLTAGQCYTATPIMDVSHHVSSTACILTDQFQTASHYYCMTVLLHVSISTKQQVSTTACILTHLLQQASTTAWTHTLVSLQASTTACKPVLLHINIKAGILPLPSLFSVSNVLKVLYHCRLLPWKIWVSITRFHFV